MVPFAACALALAAGTTAQAVTLRLCLDERSNAPYVTPSGGGVTGQLIAEAAREVGLTLTHYAAPTTRCREEIRFNAADGFPTTPYTPALLHFMVYPMRGAAPDTARAVMSLRNLVYRRAGTAAGWDGARFTQLSTPVLVRFGSMLVIDKLAAMGVQADDSAKTLEANFSKLLAGRAALVVAPEMMGQALLADPQFAGKIEVLPVPFTDEPYYLGLSRKFYHAHPQLSERLWDAIARIRRSPTYQKALHAALEDIPKAAGD